MDIWLKLSSHVTLSPLPEREMWNLLTESVKRKEGMIIIAAAELHRSHPGKLAERMQRLHDAYGKTSSNIGRGMKISVHRSAAVPLLTTSELNMVEMLICDSQ